MAKMFDVSAKGFFGAIFVALLAIGACVVWASAPDYAGELDRAGARGAGVAPGQAYGLSPGDYEIGYICGAHVTGDRYDITKSHKTTYWTVQVGKDRILVSVTDSQADAFSKHDEIMLHGTLTAVPEVLEFHPGPDVRYCLTCLGVDQEAAMAFGASMGMVLAGLLAVGFVYVKFCREDENDSISEVVA